ncbi:unnamed protein product [Ixodes hexagonus]
MTWLCYGSSSEQPIPGPPAVELHHHTVTWVHREDVHCSRCGERFDLLLAQYDADDWTNLRKSGTEEEYNERENMLQELLDLAREFGYKVRAPRRGNGAAVAPARERSTPAPTSSRNSAAASRDAAAEAYAAAIGSYSLCNTFVMSAYSLQQVFLITWNTTAGTSEQRTPGGSKQRTPDGSEQVTASQLFCHILTGDDEEDVQSPASNSGGSTNNPDQQPAGTARERRRKQDQADYDFLQKRKRHEAAIKEKEFILESRRLALEESRLA